MVHTYKFDDKNIILDTDSGTVHTAHDAAYNIVSAMAAGRTGTPAAFSENAENDGNAENAENDGNAENAENDGNAENAENDGNAEILTEIRALQKQGVLFSDHDYRPHARGSNTLKSVCLHVAHECNLRCAYCFAGMGQYGKGSISIMPPETAYAAVDFLVRQSEGRTNLELDFFGGEPLLAWDTVTATVDYAKTRYPKHSFSFTITTNGLLLDDDKIDYINENMYNVVLSLDGRREVNDRMRTCKTAKNGGNIGSYDIVLPKFQKLVQRRTDGTGKYPEYYIRGTFTRNNLDFTEDLKHIYALGFRNISTEPCTGEEYGITETELPRVKAEYETLYRWLKATPDVLFFHFNIDLSFDRAPCIIRRLRGCGCGTEYAAVTPDGDIYPCHQYADNAPYLLGNVHSGGITADNIVSNFADTHIYSKAGCTECFAKYYCGGGCNALFKQMCGSENTPLRVYCEMMRKRVELAVAMQC